MKDREKSPVQQFLLGMLILGLIGLIPLLGRLIMSVANIFSYGALLFWLLDNHHDTNTKILGIVTDKRLSLSFIFQLNKR